VLGGYFTLAQSDFSAVKNEVGVMAEFVAMEVDRAKQFLTRHHWGILATRRINGELQMSPVTVGLDNEGRAVISSRETAYKVKNLRRDPRAALCAITATFHGEGWAQITGKAEIVSLPLALDMLVYLQRQVYGEHKSWAEFHERMIREKRVIIRITIESVGPRVRG
jgi:PPOX class probable F420-dependent enzyme